MLATGALIAASAIVGVGAMGADAAVSDVGAWLPSNARGTVTHVNGLSGRVDGRVALARSNDSALEVSNDGDTVLVLDRKTGRVTRIDPALLTVAQTSDAGNPADDIATGGGRSWRISAGRGTVQAMDPVTLAPLGAPVDLGAKPLGRAQVDAGGTLWVPISATGEVVPVRESQKGPAIKVAEPGGRILVTLASGRIVVTDVVGAKTMVVTDGGVGLSITLPTDMTKGTGDKLSTPDATEGPVVPILASDTGTLTLVDIDNRSVKAVPLRIDNHEYGGPQVLGVRVYVPDRTTGSLVVYNTAQARFETPIKVTGVPGPLQITVRGGLLWANDANNATAAVVNVQGRVHEIGKDGTPGRDTPGDRSIPGETIPSAQTPSGSAQPSRPPSTSPGPQEPAEDTAPPEEPITVPAQEPPTSPEPPSNPPETTGRAPKPERSAPPPAPPRQVPGPTVTVTATVTPSSTPARPSKSARPSAPTATATPTGTTTSSGPPASSKPTRSSSPTPPASSPPSEAPMKPPGVPQAAASNGKITLTFTPAAGATPTRYRLGGSAEGLTHTPDSIAPGGAKMFTVSGGKCDTEYSFFVIADYPNGSMNSAPSTPIRPCTAPTAPKGLKITPGQGGHGATLAWSASTNTGGAQVSYQVAVQGLPTATVTAATHVVGQLKNSHAYAVSVVAGNAAGSSAALTGSIDLTPPPVDFNVGPNIANGVTIGIHPGPKVSARSPQIPAGYTGKITVHCQTRGQRVTRDRGDEPAAPSDIWDRVTYTAGGARVQGYMTDLYVRTPNSAAGTFSSARLWTCD
ncbi:hypothetical protein [Embleya hyalina]|uniref:hypothetical protein n=1 Tax=Embleya hyalina TaxID=516124 RepID=UPI000F828E1E|nr:hypothetical protein [Embleya hyalina]